MSCNVKVHNAPAVMGEYDEDKQNLERNRVHREEVDGHQLRHVIGKERSPRLGRRFWMSHHVYCDRRLGNLDAKFPKFAVNSRCSPKHNHPTYGTDQIACVLRELWTTCSASTNFPSPIEAKSFPVPT